MAQTVSINALEPPPDQGVIVSELPGDVGGEGASGADIPVFVMNEEGSMLITPEQMESIPQLREQIQEAEDAAATVQYG